MKNSLIVLETDGEEKRQFLHVRDCCEGLYKIHKNYDKILTQRKTLDLTSCKWNSIKFVSEFIAESLNAGIVVNENKAMFNFANEPDKFLLNFWEPKILLEDGISDLISEMNSNY